MTWTRPGVRGRITLAATAAVAIVLALAGVALVVLLQRDLLAGVDASARTRAQDIVALSGGALPSVLPAAQDDASVVQVLDSSGRVLAASGNIEGESALVLPNPGQRGPQISTLSGLPIGSGERFRVLQETTGPPPAHRTIVVALSLAPVDEAVQSARSLLFQVLPAALLLTALVTWLGVGRALAPVERIRRGVAAIGGGDLSKRVPLPAARDEVHRLAETMNSMLDRLEASAGRQRRFVADASHELRSPLANMQASLEVALARQDLDLWQETGQDLQGEYDRMRHLVEDLLLLARLDGRIPLAHDDVDLDDVVHEEAERLRMHAEVTVHVVPLPALRVRGDGAKLAQVVGNLADNAARHAATTVSLSLRRDGHWAVVQVADDGPGVPLEHRIRIFDRFTRLDPARARDSGGSGLGLAISREIAHAHGGTLNLLPGSGESGAIFELRLPLAATKRSSPGERSGCP
ncbi:MAG TPA: HAMP domain-containing sensor histidine kinase [Dermatophilaceae bacterium]|nr:HAMP domain-containing sensor histidine kinase [Dermatophilaceae bacterium]